MTRMMEPSLVTDVGDVRLAAIVVDGRAVPGAGSGIRGAALGVFLRKQGVVER
ncbi:MULTISPECIES: hypothetical protein [Nocardia]|uniref:hypothetical protein n=1 Tax=Nocardia TaxID=1817 RepID=UPI000A82C7EA|nr:MULTISPECIES: hypothetical protein [Nocardia]MBF6274725.1 hypothetical protein [Nocardia nova]MBV7705277.1 hypothetical protein [Nocardia nova]